MSESHVSRLSDQLYRVQGKKPSRHWLLLDPALRPLPDDSPLGLELRGREIIRVSINAGLDSSLLPLLVPYSVESFADFQLIHESLNEALGELAPASLATGAGRRICGWIDAECSAQALSAHFAKHALQRRAGHLNLLRWYDPAVFWAMWPILDDTQRATLLGPVKMLHFLDPAGEWIHSEATKAPASFKVLELSDAQWRQIDHIAPLNAVLRKLVTGLRTVTSIGHVRKVIMQALARASSIGFTDAQDLEAFALLAATVHPAFDSHPLIVTRLKRRNPADYFSMLVDDLTPDQWSAIGRELSETLQEHEDSLS